MSTPTEASGAAAGIGSISTGTTGAAGPGTAPPTLSSFLKWGAAFGIYAVVMFAFDESENYASVVDTFAWLVAGSAIVYWHKNLGQHLTELTGVQL